MRIPTIMSTILSTFSSSSYNNNNNNVRYHQRNSSCVLSVATVLLLFGMIYQLNNCPQCRLSNTPTSNSNNIGSVATADNDPEQSNQLLSMYNICRVSDDQTIGYVCRGEDYDHFAEKFEQLVLQIGSSSSKRMWGRRSDPFPDNSVTLVVGNSLTRQIFQGLPCQYSPNNDDDKNQDIKSSLVEWIDWMAKSNEIDLMRKGTFYEGRFRNNAKVYLVTNHAMFYSPKWPTYLQELIGMPLRQVDQLVVGHINHFMNAYNTSFMELMKEQTKEYDEANFETVSPPTLRDFAQIYDGPIVGISMMADWSTYDQDYYEMADQIQKISGTGSNQKDRRIKLVHGRRYIEDLGECGTNSWMDIGTCHDSPDTHRCIGRRGGHPDLILFDALEAIHDLHQ